ncbi:MAG: type II toxin-antitoxin system RelE/ParE family toxin [Acidobacteria bacterium]|nr:type II toxin-antitoxin system RelE/ParE family toxin [Acidobacteriota bacterium]
MDVQFLTPARAEFLEAIAFYNARKPGLGREFVAEVRKALRRIMDFPEAWPLISKRTRRCRVKGFPFGIIYQVRDELLLIVAVMHLHREPNSWRDRLAEPPQ